MTGEEFEAEVQKLETFARQNPQMYRRRVTKLTWLGYGVAYALLGLCLLLGLGLLTLLFSGGLGSLIGFLCLTALLVPLGGTIMLVWQSLKVQLEPPRGLRLKRAAAGTLYDAVDALTVAIGSPKVHQIVLVPEATAAMAQLPRLGLFGWYRNTLIVGLPLMQAMSVQQFSAIIAHEMAHLSGRHGQLGAWVYRTQQVWTGLMASFEMQQKAGAAAVPGPVAGAGVGGAGINLAG